MTVGELVADEDGDLYELIDQLDAVKTMIMDMGKRWDVEPPEELVGLPLDDMINRHRNESLEALHRAEADQAARQKRKETARTERLQQESTNRVRRAEEEATFVVPDTAVFMDAPLPGHDGKTRRQLAYESTAGPAIVQADLEQIRDNDRKAAEAEKLRKDMIAKLWDRVYSRVPDRARADLWPTQRWPDLGGVRPIDFCKDQTTLERCFEILEEWVNAERKRGRRR